MATLTEGLWRIRRHAARALIAPACLFLAASASAAITTYPVGSGPSRIAVGPDGAMYFGIDRGLGRITTAGAARSFRLPGAATPNPPEILGVTVAPDGTAWATEQAGRIARVAPTGAITEFSPPTLGQATGIAVAADGRVWFTESDSGRVGRLDAAEAFTELVLGMVPGAGSRLDPPAPTEMVIGPGGAPWFLQLSAGHVVRVDALGGITAFGLPAGPVSAPTALAPGPDGALWITEAGVGRIARMTTDGAEPRAITAGPDGAMWFTESGTDRIGRIDPAGHVTEYAMPAGSSPYGIVAGADGALWVTLRAANRIARVPADTPAISAATTASVRSHRVRRRVKHRARR